MITEAIMAAAMAGGNGGSSGGGLPVIKLDTRLTLDTTTSFSDAESAELTAAYAQKMPVVVICLIVVDGVDAGTVSDVFRLIDAGDIPMYFADFLEFQVIIAKDGNRWVAQVSGLESE